MENYRCLYKVPSKASRIDESKRGEKRETALREQRKKREDTFFKKRNIAEEDCSLAPSTSKNAAQASRREKLLRWKAEKERLLAQEKLRANKKPPFKVGVLHHTLDPTKEFAPAVRATSVKCTTAKKVAAETRADASEKLKAKPSAAALSLASLSAPDSEVPKASATFSGRVTRSRTAAIAAAKTSATSSKVSAKVSKAPAASSKPSAAASKPPAAASKPSAAASKLSAATSKGPTAARTQRGITTHNITAAQRNTQRASERKKPTQLDSEQSFAPQDYKFKAPATLTFPTTPLTLKRKRAGAKEADWPTISGVNFLNTSPSEPSPSKVPKTAASQRRGRLSRVHKEQTPNKSSKHNQSPQSKGSQSNGFIISEVTSNSNLLEENPDHQLAAKSPHPSKKSSRKSRGFTVIEVPKESEVNSKTAGHEIVETSSSVLKNSRMSALAPDSLQGTSDLQEDAKSPIPSKKTSRKSGAFKIIEVTEATDFDGQETVHETPSKSSSSILKSGRKSSRGVAGAFPMSEVPQDVEATSNGTGVSDINDAISAMNLDVSKPSTSGKKTPRKSYRNKSNTSNKLEGHHKDITQDVDSPSKANDVEKTISAMDLEVSRTSNSTKSFSVKENVNPKEKENILMESDDNFLAAEQSDIFHEIKSMDPMMPVSGRMSIHEPSPPVNITPDKLMTGLVPAQFSPYVTSARGKDKYSTQKRRNSLIPQMPDISPEELVRTQQVEHFRNLLERESSRLLTLSSLWEERQAEAPAHVQDLILGPIGQARLLVKDKFQQFRRLVDKFELGDTEGKISADDLTGFWEMMLLTVDNVDKRFKELEELKSNDWQERIVEAPIKKNVVPIQFAPKPSNKAPRESKIKGIIEAARKIRRDLKQKSSNNSSNVTTFDGGFFQVQSPKKILPSPKVTPKVLPSTPLQSQRRSLLQHVLTNSAVRAQNSSTLSALNRSLPTSPSPKIVVAQIRASELGKRMSMGSVNGSNSTPSSPVSKAEPTKSILKSAVGKNFRANTPRNRVAFQVLGASGNSTGGTPTSLSSEGTPPSSLTPTSKKVVTPGSGKKRTSLIPRLISTPGQGDRPSLGLGMARESLIPSKPLPGGDLIAWESPKADSKARRSRRSNIC